jgi:hypothetical protein
MRGEGHEFGFFFVGGFQFKSVLNQLDADHERHEKNGDPQEHLRRVGSEDDLDQRHEAKEKRENGGDDVLNIEKPMFKNCVGREGDERKDKKTAQGNVFNVKERDRKNKIKGDDQAKGDDGSDKHQAILGFFVFFRGAQFFDQIEKTSENKNKNSDPENTYPRKNRCVGDRTDGGDLRDPGKNKRRQG